MARKTADVTITVDNRDKGKTFRLTELSASQAESWSLRAIQAMTRGGMEIPEGVAEAGMPAIIATGLVGLFRASFADVGPLLDEMFTCVTIIVEAAPEGRKLVENDIEEVTTRVQLRDEILSLHLGFSPATVLQTAVALNSLVKTALPTSDTNPLAPESAP